MLIPVVLVLPLVLAWMKEPAGARAAAANAGPAAAGARQLPGMTFAAGLRDPRFWMLKLALALAVACIVTLVTSGMPLLRAKGLDATNAAGILGSFGLSLIFGRVVGHLVGRLWAPGVAAVALALPALGCLLLGMTGAGDNALLIVGVILIGSGIGAGAEFGVAAFMTSRHFGPRDCGRLFGAHLGLITLASTLAPWLFGLLLYRGTGNHDAMLLIFGVLFLCGGLSLLALGCCPRFATTTTPSAPPAMQN